MVTAAVVRGVVLVLLLLLLLLLFCIKAILFKKKHGKAKKTKPPQNALRVHPWPNSEPKFLGIRLAPNHSKSVALSTQKEFAADLTTL